MNSAIDQPKSKSITIAFISFKAMILGLIFTEVYKKIDNKQNCMDLTSEIAIT